MAASRVRAIARLARWEPDTDREELLALILCGDVRFDGVTVRDPKETVLGSSAVTYRDSGFVGRGGIKLNHALEMWGIDVAGKIAVDAGASTGGFTHALLLRGVAQVHAVDVGTNQLDYRLRVDRRVTVHEKTNILDVTHLDPQPEFAVADLSFRSLCGAAAHLLRICTGRWGIMLLKPQFEWRTPPKDFGGRVPDAEAEGIVGRTLERLSDEGVVAERLLESPIRGRSGNREFLILVRYLAAWQQSGNREITS